MKLRISKEWCMRMAQLEGDAEIGAGRLAIDPVFDGDTAPVVDRDDEEPNIAFGRLINFMRRRRRVSLEQLAKAADVTVPELVEIETDTRYKPALRTTYQLANYFNMPRAGFMQVAGLTARKNAHLSDEAVRFAARAEPTAELTPEENAVLEAFVAVLSKQK